MTEKKLSKVTVHTTPERKTAIEQLASLDGVSASEYADRVMRDHLKAKFDALSILIPYQEANGAHRAVRAPHLRVVG